MITPPFNVELKCPGAKIIFQLVDKLYNTTVYFFDH